MNGFTVTLTEDALGFRLATASETLSGVFAALETAIADPKAPWVENPRSKGARGRKKREEEEIAAEVRKQIRELRD